MTRKLTAATALTATLTLLATGCSASTDNTAPTGSPVATSTPSTTTAPAPAPSTATRTPTVTEVSPTSATPTPTVSIDPSPLAGAGGGPQQPSSEAVLTSITDEDRARAVDAAKAIITAYTSGKPYKEWSAELFPLIDPELQNEYDSKFRVDLLKGTVTGAEITHDPTTDIPGGDNPYWITVRVKVDGGISPEYYVRLHRTSERPNKWKASHILEPQAFNSFVNNKLKNRK